MRRCAIEIDMYITFRLHSAGVCFDGKERLHLIPDKTKVNAKLYVETLLPEQIQECRSVLPSGFIFQQDGAPAHMTKLSQDWIAIPTAVNSLVKMNGLRTHLISTLWTAMSFQPSRRTVMSSRKFCIDMGPAATRLDQQSHIELPEKTSGLCESW